MTKERLQALKNVLMWCGVGITFSGILLNVVSGTPWQGNVISLFGLVTTCIGNFLSITLARHQANQKAADKERISKLERRLEHLIKNPPPARAS